MRLGLVARSDSGGLGTMTQDFARHLHPDRVLVVDLGARGRGPARLGRFPSAQVVAYDYTTGTIPEDAIAEFCAGLDVIYGAETLYHPRFASIARDAGARTVLMAMPELWRADHDPPDVVLAPTTWLLDRLPPDTTVLAVPVARDRLPGRLRTAPARHLVHQTAPAFQDRNGTALLGAALPHLRHVERLTVRCDHNRSLPPAWNRLGRPIRPQVVAVGPFEDYWQGWPDDADAFVLPRRFGGLSLVVQEAASLGLPVVMIDGEPQRSWLPPEALVPQRWVGGRTVPMAGGRVTVSDCRAVDLAARLDALATDADLVTKLSQASLDWADSISWERLLPAYREMLERARGVVV